MSIKTIRESKAWKAINDISVLKWLISGVVALISWVNSYMRDLPFGLMVIYAGGAAIIALLGIDLAITVYRKYAKPPGTAPQAEKTMVARLANLALGFMIEQAELFLRLYRELDQHERDQVKFPLSPNSCPDFGQKWELRHARLWALRQHLDWLVLTAETAWKEMGWTDRPMLFVDAKDSSIVMANLLGSLEDFKLRIKDKLSLFGPETKS